MYFSFNFFQFDWCCIYFKNRGLVGLLNRQNPLSKVKVISWWPLAHVYTGIASFLASQLATTKFFFSESAMYFSNFIWKSLQSFCSFYMIFTKNISIRIGIGPTTNYMIKASWIYWRKQVEYTFLYNAEEPHPPLWYQSHLSTYFYDWMLVTEQM